MEKAVPGRSRGVGTAGGAPQHARSTR